MDVESINLFIKEYFCEFYMIMVKVMMSYGCIFILYQDVNCYYACIMDEVTSLILPSFLSEGY